MKSLRVITVDDEPLALERVSTLVRDADGLELIGEGRNGIQALDLITSLKPDLVFIDVEMPELSGFGAIAALEGEAIPGVVFVTAYDHYAVKAFEVGAIDYLSKPVSRARFSAAVSRAKDRLKEKTASARVRAEAVRHERQRGERKRFVVRRGNAHFFVPVESIDWIDGADNYLRLHVGDRADLWRGTMKDAEDQLDDAMFVRVHRSAIVAIDRIASISPEAGTHVVELKNGMRLRSSRHYSERVRKLLR